ncbi:MAG: hypothetical protein ACN4GT_02495 [Gammaproteobacteria bacterium]
MQRNSDMRMIVLVLAWITPALVAGMLGWSGTWGGSSAVMDYLIPIPVAGGVFHVPSFVVAAAMIFSLRGKSEAQGAFVLMLALAIFLAALTLQIDFDRLNEALFTDYEPRGSPLRFDGNPFFLFITTDALWVAIYALASGYTLSSRGVLLLAAVPATIVGAQMISYSTGGTKLTYGFSSHIKEIGNGATYVHTPGGYDEALFRRWIEDTDYVLMPWESVNTENEAVHFTNSMQAIRWRNTESVEGIVGTICFHEADRSSSAHAGYFDCFADHPTVRQRMKQSMAETDTGFGRKVNLWFANAKLCDGVDVPDDYVGDIAMLSICLGMRRKYPEFLGEITVQFGRDSAEVQFVRSNAGLIGMESTGTAGNES